LIRVEDRRTLLLTTARRGIQRGALDQRPQDAFRSWAKRWKGDDMWRIGGFLMLFSPILVIVIPLMLVEFLFPSSEEEKAHARNAQTLLHSEEFKQEVRSRCGALSDHKDLWDICFNNVFRMMLNRMR
jgi:hypothetical protein